jgi:hypothetical protein
MHHLARQAAQEETMNDTSDTPETVQPEEQPRDRPPLGRRLFVLKLATLGGAAAATAGCVPQQQPVVYVPQQPVYAPTRTGISDSDPSDPPGAGRGGHRGSGVTDNDPSDAPGFGRGGRRYTGISDNDPNDPPGRGRGGYRAAPVRYRTGFTDADPSDGPGYGRGGARYRTGLSDSDPRDAPGRGRRGY